MNQSLAKEQVSGRTDTLAKQENLNATSCPKTSVQTDAAANATAPIVDRVEQRTAPIPEFKELLKEGQVLRTSNPAEFRNQPLTCQISKEQIELKGLQGTETFGDLQAKRKAAAANTADAEKVAEAFQRSGGAPLTNVGISLAITAVIDKKRYALLVRQDRGEDTVLKLISGYVDASRYLGESKNLLTAGDFQRAFRDEINDELVVSRNGETLPLLVAGFGATERLPSAYNLPASQSLSATFKACEVPSYVLAAQGAQKVQVDGMPLQNASFYIHQPTGSGQIVMGGELSVPKGSSLQHIEDVLNKKSGLLESVVRSSDLVYMALDDGGTLTGKAYKAEKGQLMEIALPEKTIFSEAFASPKAGVIVPAKNVPLRDMRL